MSRLFDELRADLAAFVEQREALTLVLWAKSTGDIFYVLKLLESLDETSPRDIIIPFTEDCYEVNGYLSSLMAACDMDIEAANQAIASGLGEDGATPWDSLPDTCFDEQLPPIERIRALVAHIRRYYPDPAHRIVLALLPMKVSRPDAYREIANTLIPRGGFEPWMAGLRVILWDERRNPRFVHELIADNAFGTLVRPVDFSADALSRAMVQTANDPNAPEEERMTAYLQVATLDHAWGRYAEALVKYRTALGYYERTKNAPMQGVCLLFAGYTFEQMQRNDQARGCYHRTLDLAIPRTDKQLMLNAYMALGGLHQRESDWGPAAQYWEVAAWTAKDMNNLYVVVEAAKQGGVCHVALNDPKRALELWEQGKLIAQQLGYWDGAIAILSMMIEVERRAGMDEPRARHEQELAAAQAEAEQARREVAQARAATGVGGQPS